MMASTQISQNRPAVGSIGIGKLPILGNIQSMREYALTPNLFPQTEHFRLATRRWSGWSPCMDTRTEPDEMGFIVWPTGDGWEKRPRRGTENTVGLYDSRDCLRAIIAWDKRDGSNLKFGIVPRFCIKEDANCVVDNGHPEPDIFECYTPGGVAKWLEEKGVSPADLRNPFARWDDIV